MTRRSVSPFCSLRTDFCPGALTHTDPSPGATTIPFGFIEFLSDLDALHDALLALSVRSEARTCMPSPTLTLPRERGRGFGAVRAVSPAPTGSASCAGRGRA